MIIELQHIADIGAFLKEEPEVYLVYDRNVEWVAREIPGHAGNDDGAGNDGTKGNVKKCFGIETSEQLKTMDSVLALERRLLEAGASRNALLVAVGGGITTDLVGFAAATYKRGIRYVNLPTTLLAQVDAAIGGKTGVNLDGYKNMVGAFHMPEHSFICADVLRTLPPREFRSGVAELLKTFLLGDAAAYEEAVRALSGAETADLATLIHRAAQIKEQIVTEDPHEHGVRAKLNLGHSFAHAIEHEARVQGADITHGEAVAMGIVMAAKVSEAAGLADQGLAARIEADFRALGLPTESPFPLETLKAAMQKDKKADGSKVKFVLPASIGQVVFKDLSPFELMNTENRQQ